MKRCPACQFEVPESAIQCESCGRQLEVIVESSEGTTQFAEVDRTSEQLQELALRDIRVGAFWCIGGIIVTAVTYNAAASSPTGGHYVIAWGAIIFGAIQFFKGLARYQ